MTTFLHLSIGAVFIGHQLAKQETMPIKSTKRDASKEHEHLGASCVTKLTCSYHGLVMMSICLSW